MPAGLPCGAIRCLRAIGRRMGMLSLSVFAVVCAFALFAPRTRAEWISTEVRIDPGRALHDFAAFNMEGTSPDWSGAGAFAFDHEGRGYLSLQVSADLVENFLLFDSHAGQSLAFPPPPHGASVDLRGFTWAAPGDPAPPVYFILPAARAQDLFALQQPDGANYQAWIDYYSPGTIGGLEVVKGSASHDPAQPFWLVDLANGLRAPNGETNLAHATWTPLNQSPPLVAATVLVEGRELGHRFTVYSRATGGPVVA